MPLYPQFADSTVTTVVEEVKRVMRRHRLGMEVDVIRPFFDQPEYVAALADSIRPYWNDATEHLLLSYHGLPERHIRKADPTRKHCLASADCCQCATDEVLDRSAIARSACAPVSA